MASPSILILGSFLVLAAAAPGAAEPETAPPATAASPSATAFGLDQVEAEARALAAAPYASPTADVPAFYTGLNYDQQRDIRYNKEQALWHAQNLPMEIEFFHPGAISRKSVAIYEVVDGEPRLIPFNRDNFIYGPLVPTPPEGTPAPTGFGGFRAHANLDKPDYKDEFVVFQGASYFRAIAPGQVYGLSARGLAINPAQTAPEEFPVFEKFWLVRPAADAKSVKVYALLNGPSVAGAYEFQITPGTETVMDVTAVLYFRRDNELVGLAPISSMYWFGDNTRPRPDDWRAAVHDSDGLLVATHDDEWDWQPLDPGAKLRRSDFPETKLAGFGLVQRERDYAAYRDLEARYHDRPSLWVEPLGDWGPGTVRLIELPPGKEFFDNIVACWEPATHPAAGQPSKWRYRLHWNNEPAEPATLCKVISTLHGRAVNFDDTEFVIDFDQPKTAAPPTLPELDASGGDGALIRARQIIPNPVTGGWRAILRVRLKPGFNSAQVSCQLYRNGSPISEKWNYLWTPP